jgi:hypothetical protein
LLLDPVQIGVELQRKSGIAKKARFVATLVILGSQHLPKMVLNVGRKRWHIVTNTWRPMVPA